MDVFACLLKHVRNVAVFAAALVVLSAFVDAKAPEGRDGAAEGVTVVEGGETGIIGRGEPVSSVAAAAGHRTRD